MGIPIDWTLDAVGLGGTAEWLAFRGIRPNRSSVSKLVRIPSMRVANFTKDAACDGERRLASSINASAVSLSFSASGSRRLVDVIISFPSKHGSCDVIKLRTRCDRSVTKSLHPNIIIFIELEVIVDTTCDYGY